MNEKKNSKPTKAQVLANQRQNESRKGKPTFTGIKFDSPADQKKLDEINETILRFGSTKKAATIEAFRLLKNDMDSEDKKKQDKKK